MSSDGTEAGRNNGDGTVPRSVLDLLLSLHTAPGSCSHVRAAATVHTHTTHCSNRKISFQLLGDPDSSPSRCLMRQDVFNPISLSKVLSVVVDSSTLRTGQEQIHREVALSSCCLFSPLLLLHMKFFFPPKKISTSSQVT